jgi:hypothetical protein
LKAKKQSRTGAKTPAGVWIIIGLGLFFALGGFGIAAFIALRALHHG